MLKICVKQPLGTLSLAVEIEIASQGVTAIFGRSGAGKSSLINIISGLSTPLEGQIYLNERTLFDCEKRINLPPEKRNIGYVFQEPRLFPHYTVAGNLKYGCKRLESDKFLHIVQLLGIEPLLNRYPDSLSGGEKQRVAIGRALLSNPEMLLMDEPLSALDLPRKNELLAYLSQLAKQVKIPILYVSHSLDEVVRLADKMVLLDKGNVIAYAPTSEVINSPIFSPWQAETKTSLLELPIIGEHADYKLLQLGLGTQSVWVNTQPRYQMGDKLRIRIASRDVSLALQKPEQTSIRNILFGTICQIERQPDRLDIALAVEQQQIWATISLWAFDELQLALGQAIYLQIKSISI